MPVNYICIKSSLLMLLFTFSEGRNSQYYSSSSVIADSSKNSICSGGSSISQSGFQVISQPHGNSKLGMIGDVNDVLQGRVLPSVETNIWSPTNTGPFGFGAAAIGPISGLGEAIFVNGVAFVRSTDNGTENYFQTVTDHNFRTSFSLFVQSTAKPSAVAQFSCPAELESCSITDFSNLYERIYHSVGNNPFCFTGLANFVQLDAIAVSKAPIYNEPLFGEIAEGYYTKPNFQIPNTFGFVIGCAANFSTVADPILRKTLEKLLYLNPKDVSAENQLHVHSHVLSLKRCLGKPEEIRREDGQDVFHLLSNATVNYVHFNVYPFERNEALEQLSPNGSPASQISTLTGTTHSVYITFTIYYLVTIMRGQTT